MRIPRTIWRRVYGELGIVHGVVMGNRSLDPGYHNYPADLFHLLHRPGQRAHWAGGKAHP